MKISFFRYNIQFQKTQNASGLSSKSKIDLLIPVLIGFGSFWFVFGFDKLLPANNNWLMFDDWATHYLGWEFFRRAPWDFPLGRINNYFSPFGSNICFTDTPPLYSIIFKAFGFLFPDSGFQITGFWFLISWILTAWYSDKILQAAHISDRFYRTLAVLIITFAPVLISRLHHATLCAQWLILASIYFYLSEARTNNNLGKQLILLVISAATHPYLWLMVLLLSLALILKVRFYTKSISNFNALMFLILSFSLSLFIFYCIGYFSVKSENAAIDPYGFFSANLNTYFNPMSGSFFLLPLKVHHNEQGDAFGYLGLPFLISIPFLLYFKGSIIKEYFSHKKSYFPLFTASVALFLFAVSTKITFSDSIVYEFIHVGPINKIGAMFRASGRFIWTGHYLLLIFILVIIYRFFVFNRILIFLITVFQLVDIHPILLNYSKLKEEPKTYSFDQEEFLKKHMRDCNRLVFYKPFERTLVKTDDYMGFASVCAALNKPITTGYVARYNFTEGELYKNTLLPDSIHKGILTNSLYVTNNTYVIHFFNALVEKKAFWIKMNDYNYIVHSTNPFAADSLSKGNYKRYDKIVDFLNRNKKLTIVASVKDEATAFLSDSAKNYLISIGSKINHLSYRGSYILILSKSKIITEVIENEKPIVLEYANGSLLGDAILTKSLKVESAGGASGNFSHITLNGTDYSKNMRGLNFVSLDESLNVIESLNVDSHYSSEWVRFEATK